MSIITLLLGALLVLDLAKALKMSGWGYVLCCFLPWVGLFSLLILSSKATRVLQKNDILVRFMGANETDIARKVTSS